MRRAALEPDGFNADMLTLLVVRERAGDIVGRGIEENAAESVDVGVAGNEVRDAVGVVSDQVVTSLEASWLITKSALSKLLAVLRISLYSIMNRAWVIGVF